MRAIVIMFATYTRIPMPHIPWDDRSARYAICAFPLAGAVIGLVQWGLLLLMNHMSVPVAAKACVLIAAAILITGGIHLDGLVDTADARSSYADREKKLQILKDPHVGAFGILRLALYLMLVFAGLDTVLTHDLRPRALFAALLIPVFSRACSGLAAELLPRARKSGMLTDLIGEKASEGPARVLAVWLAACIVALLTEPPFALLYLAAQALLTLYYRRMAVREFGGVTGDLAGWYLCMSELAGIWALVIAGWIR